MVCNLHYPLIEEIKTDLSCVALFELIKATISHNRPMNTTNFFLDSGMDPQRLGRFSFLGYDPFLILKTEGNEAVLLSDTNQSHIKGNPFYLLQHLLDIYRLDSGATPVPFLSGAVGYLSYDLCHLTEKLPDTALNDLHLPECYFGFYDSIIAFDNLDGKAYIVSSGFPELFEPQRTIRATQRLYEIKDLLSSIKRPRNYTSILPAASQKKKLSLKGNFTHEDYMLAVEKARQYIIAGDIFEVNLSQRFETEISMTPYELYGRLRQLNPAPFACYLEFPGVTIASASPERFLRLQGDQVETRPIKGTRPRGKTRKQDEILSHELLSSTKDRAENIMIVDLERNDLGRVCRFGSVKVSELTILEQFPTVFHLTSTVTGQLRQEKNGIDLLKATFPGGSITGAPKIRAMEIIDELEPTKRSIYTGSIGYLGFNGDLDLNIAIRTFLIKEGKAYFQVGGAIVYDSDPENEYQETLDKGRALVNALNATDI